MSDGLTRLSVSAMSSRERAVRSELKQRLLDLGLLRGYISVRERSCGKPNCHCKKGGPKHPALYLVASKDGKPEQLFIAEELEGEPREWVDSYQRLRELLEELSELHWQKLRQRKD